MSRQLVFVHGRAQENKNADKLKGEWIKSLNEGLAKSNLKLPISEQDVRFPYYGDTLYQMSKGKSSDQAAAVIVRGEQGDALEKAFMAAVLEEVRQKQGITDEQLAAIGGEELIERGPLNWEWVQTILKAIDRYVPGGSGASIALATYDVYQYLKNSNIRTIIDDGVSQAVTPGRETVVVSHSLGTVVAYHLLQQRGQFAEWKVPLFVTLGSPLAVTEIRKTMKFMVPPRCPVCVSNWFNAMDERDVVALYPLNPANFPLNPPKPSIENKTDVRNGTENRHGISGYLDDQQVAKRIYDALVA